ncbi:xaa-Pro aminopeptidase 1 [Frankliniella occidentalis]|uniref:Xaa-Pro aminopeptidase 1 n=1 Tax=Frankliniella occidentalis TaxID=133901 RepID=A0A6J1TKN6_FRAOC|nr:xaa-Pro aminopeptidase 1 [Frankliniella occidentalis]XP_026292243.1 xaa-Pro aminopeptidase 1 [Frankliniella occidentalis]XP_026292244.1 xaa-Pro aminopeptidase 1 [Frankliniella occidentalis]XP_026292245.1 xaa-Pro aminopeptidase 1 [Frankliniella occidentalis]
MVNLKSTSQLLEKLRALMKNTKYVQEPIHAYIVPSEDRHQSEYIAECDRRRAFITGFTGSSGTAVVTEKDACLWTDGRYYLQATQEMDKNWTLMKLNDPGTPTESVWLSKVLPIGSRVGVDPQLMSYDSWHPMQTQLEASGMLLVPIQVNLIDVIWEDRPAPPCNIVQPHPLKYSGKACSQKVQEVRLDMSEKGASLLVVTALDEIAWLLNLRGSDIDYNPVFFSYVIVTPNDVHLFADKSKLTSAVHDHFNQEGLPVTFHPYEKVYSFLTEEIVLHEGKVWLSYLSSYGLMALIPERKRLTDISPIAVMKAMKNPTEVNGLINCHIRDGAAVCCYLAWLEKEVSKGVVTEVSGATKLEEFRKQMDEFVGLSFTTISSAGPNGAIIHYTPSEDHDRLITANELYLCDSGAQFRDGTTDVTRTVHFGTPTEYEKECFTRVFKGQASLSSAVFPQKIKGHYLDTLARKYLWDVGLDYLHGTGHGIGSYLNVHEGPMGVSWRTYPDDPGLSEGMFLSNEPGYYEDGKFGIRLENIERVVPVETKYNLPIRKFLTFETVTMVPIQTKMLVPGLLTEKEISYLNNYHMKVRELVGPLLKKMGHLEALEWLYRETEPIG